MPYSDPIRSKEYHKRKSAEWAKAHPDKMREACQKWREENRDYWSEHYGPKYYAAHLDAMREKNRRCARELTDGYVRRSLAQGCSIPAKNFAKSLVEVKRVEIQLRRWLRDNETSKKHGAVAG